MRVQIIECKVSHGRFLTSNTVVWAEEERRCTWHQDRRSLGFKLITDHVKRKGLPPNIRTLLFQLWRRRERHNFSPKLWCISPSNTVTTHSSCAGPVAQVYLVSVSWKTTSNSPCIKLAASSGSRHSISAGRFSKFHHHYPDGKVHPLFMLFDKADHFSFIEWSTMADGQKLSHSQSHPQRERNRAHNSLRTKSRDQARP